MSNFKKNVSIDILAHRKSLLLLKSIQQQLLTLPNPYTINVEKYANLLLLMQQTTKLARESLKIKKLKKDYKILFEELKDLKKIVDNPN